MVEYMLQRSPGKFPCLMKGSMYRQLCRTGKTVQQSLVSFMFFDFQVVSCTELQVL